MECTVCLNLFTSEVYKPLFLSCGHSLCILCVKGLRKNSGQFKCPTCMQDMMIEDVNLMPVNYQLINEVIQQSPEVNKIKETPCPRHPYKNIKLMCLDWRETFCSLCVSAHSGHKIEVAEKAVNKFIDTQFDDLTGQQFELLTDLQRLKERNEEILTRNDMLKTQIVEIANSAMRSIKDQKENLLIVIAESEKANENLITAAEVLISDINSKFNELREFKNASYTTRVSTFELFKDKLVTVQPIEQNLTAINFSPSEIPPIFIGFIEETIISTETPQLVRWICWGKQRSVDYDIQAIEILEDALNKDVKMIDIGKEIIDIKRMVSIDKNTRQRRPVKRIIL